ncbi:unknown [Prevotella sp. CAG:487]|nr:unknown [Prevotella sp. CAG:487]
MVCLSFLSLSWMMKIMCCCPLLIQLLYSMEQSSISDFISITGRISIRKDTNTFVSLIVTRFLQPYTVSEECC